MHRKEQKYVSLGDSVRICHQFVCKVLLNSKPHWMWTAFFYFDSCIPFG